MTRQPLILAAVTAALALGACGSSGDGSGPASGSKRDKAFDGALKFSQCMREHGIDMPDPQRVGTGGIKITGPKLALNSPKMKSAQSACQKYMDKGGGETVDPAKRAQLQEAALNYARCMRQQGVDMPDPQMSGNGGHVTFKAGGGSGNHGSGADRKGLGVNPNSPKFKAADKVCNHFLGDRLGPSTSAEKDK
jgi:hypothetical protein